MKLARKVELACTAINSITRHDDASSEEIGECVRLVREHITAELAAATSRREAKKVAALAAIKGDE